MLFSEDELWFRILGGVILLVSVPLMVFWAIVTLKGDD
jgi:hypothetical protein